MTVRLRELNHADIPFLWHLRNQPDVHRYFKHAQPVAWEEHVAWAIGYLTGQRDGAIFIVEADGVSAGHVRFDFDEGEATVSIALLAMFRGRGIARDSLRDACERVRHDGRMSCIRAEIHADNAASVNLFVHEGFLEVESRDSWRQFTLTI